MVCFEGGDGMGKATQSKLLADKLGAKLISFPRYETEIGKVILGSIKGEWAAWTIGREVEDRHDVDELLRSPVNALVRQALFLMDRYNTAPIIEGYLASGTDVVLDRYWPSGVVYGASDGLDENMLIRVHMRLPQPDVWILLDGPVEESTRRRPERRDQYEKDDRADWRRQAYLGLFVHQQGNWFVTNALGTVYEVHEHVLKCCRFVFGADFLK
jgi:dTMP kinase